MEISERFLRRTLLLRRNQQVRIKANDEKLIEVMRGIVWTELFIV